MSLCSYHEREQSGEICQAQPQYIYEDCPECNPTSAHPDSYLRPSKRTKITSTSSPRRDLASNKSSERTLEEVRQSAFYELKRLYKELEDLQRQHRQPPRFEAALRSRLREYRRELFQKKESMKENLSIDTKYIENVITDYEDGI